MAEDVSMGQNPKDSTPFQMVAVGDNSTSGTPRGYAWRRFDGFWFANDANGEPLVGQFTNHAAVAVAIMGGTIANRADLDFGSPIPV